MPDLFKTLTPSILNNDKVRLPQKEAYAALEKFATSGSDEREVGIVLPVGCGKSGCITLTPFAFRSKRTLVVAPGVKIAEQLENDFDPTKSTMFYRKCNVLLKAPFPEPVAIRGTETNRGDLDEADVVITNIQQLQRAEENRWLQTLPQDYFDLIIFDEGHHSVAESWDALKRQFPNATIVNFSATPERADGQIMAGQVIYSFPIFKAIEAGYVKRLRAMQLNPATLRYVRREDGKEIEVDLEEVKRLGETQSDFRRSIVTSKETLTTIVDASIRALEIVRTANGDDKKLKIIASALNIDHCIQIVEAYRSRGLKADYVHSREESKLNEKVMERLSNHELDVIVQVRKLGEGFDHPYLAVAAVFSVFSSLAPFVQFVGRIMRVIVQNQPEHTLNQGIVVYHAGANIHTRWDDFKYFSEADQQYFEELFPVEFVGSGSSGNGGGSAASDISPYTFQDQTEVRSQTDVRVQEIQLLKSDEEAAIKLLQERGFISADFDPNSQVLEPVLMTKAKIRHARRESLADRTKNEAGRILGARNINPFGKELDRKHIGQINLVVMKSAIDRGVNATVGRGPNERSDLVAADLDLIDENFASIVERAIAEVFNGN